MNDIERMDRFIKRAASILSLGKTEEEVFTIFLEDLCSPDLCYLAVKAGSILLKNN